MGSLKPGAKYVYHRQDGVVYAQEVGAPASERVEIGWVHEEAPKSSINSLHEQIMESKLWGEIRRMAETNPAMQEELERVKTFYYLLKEKDPVDWHPV